MKNSRLFFVPVLPSSLPLALAFLPSFSPTVGAIGVDTGGFAVEGRSVTAV